MNQLDKHTTSSHTTEQGFTLIELMIVLVVMAVLTVIAVPAYNAQIMGSRRDEGNTFLLQAAVKQEQFYLDNSVYTADMTDLGYALSPALSSEGFYEITAIIANAGQTFAFTATRKGAQVSDTNCGNLTLNNFGVKWGTGTDPDPGKNCW